MAETKAVKCKECKAVTKNDFLCDACTETLAPVLQALHEFSEISAEIRRLQNRIDDLRFDLAYQPGKILLEKFGRDMLASGAKSKTFGPFKIGMSTKVERLCACHTLPLYLCKPEGETVQIVYGREWPVISVSDSNDETETATE